MDGKTSEKKPCRLVGYVRVSTQKQGDSGLGAEAQHAAIAAYVASSECTLIKTYEEIESGKRNDRPQMTLAIAHAKRAKATLVIAKLDRLSRNVHFITGLQESHVQFVACDNPHVNTFTVHILAAVAQEEARLTSVRTKAALEALKARGLYSEKQKRVVTLGAPHHLTREGGLKGSAKGAAATKKKAVEAYAYIAPTIAAYRAEGLGYLAIAKRLNAADEETRNGKQWSAMQVKRVLQKMPAEPVLPFRGVAA